MNQHTAQKCTHFLVAGKLSSTQARGATHFNQNQCQVFDPDTYHSTPQCLKHNKIPTRYHFPLDGQHQCYSFSANFTSFLVAKLRDLILMKLALFLFVLHFPFFLFLFLHIWFFAISFYSASFEEEHSSSEILKQMLVIFLAL